MTSSIRTHEQPSSDGMCVSTSLLILVSSFFYLTSPDTGLAIGFSMTPVGGSATGRVGDTIVVAIDMTLEEGEYVTIAGPSLMWDLEGGDVLDAIRAHEEPDLQIGDSELHPLGNFWNLWDLDEVDAVEAGLTSSWATALISTSNSEALSDRHAGPTMIQGFDHVSTVLNDARIVVDINTNGLRGAGTYRMGTIEFLLRQVGTTQVGYWTRPTSGFRTFIAGSRGEEYPGNQVQLTPLTLSADDLVSLTINVVPEPGTALMLGLGLIGLASRRGSRVCPHEAAR